MEQQINEELQKTVKFNEELSETSAFAQKEVSKLEKLLGNSDKRISQLAQAIQTLEGDKQNLEDKVEHLRQRETETKSSVMELQSELNYKDQVIASLEESGLQLKLKLEEQQQMLTHFTDVNEQLKLEKSKLEKNFRETLTRNTLSNQVKSDSPNSGILKCPKLLHLHKYTMDNTHVNTTPNSFNSPTLLRMLQCPISPNVSFQNNEKLIIGDELLFGIVPPSNTSTPERKYCLNSICNDTQCSPNKLPLLNHCQFPDNENINNCKLSECVGKELSTTDSNLNIITSHNASGSNLDDDTRGITTNEEKLSLLSCITELTCNKSTVYCSSNSIETSSEDEAFWKLQMIQHSPRESLESEITQISDVENDGTSNISLIQKKYVRTIQKQKAKLVEHENTIKQLLEEINCLKQNAHDNVNNEQLQIASESKNNHKYIEITQLVDKYKSLQRNMETINSNHSYEINMYKRDLNKVESERDELKQQLEQTMLDKPDGEFEDKSFLKIAYEELQKKLEQCLHNENEMSKKNLTLTEENAFLKNELIELNAVLCKLNSEKSDINKCVEKLITQEEVSNISPIENWEKIQEQTGTSAFLGSRRKTKLSTYLHEIVNSYESRIETLTNEIAELNTVNLEISRTLNERNVQITTLKDMIYLQNNKISSLEGEKSEAADKLYNARIIREKYLEENDQLKKKLEQAEVENVAIKNNSNLTQDKLENVNKDYLQIKKSYDALVQEYDALINLKKSLQKRNADLASECKELKNIVQKLEKELNHLECEKEEFIMDRLKAPNLIEEVSVKMLSAKTEIFRLETSLATYKADLEMKHSEELEALLNKISYLENVIQTLESDKSVLLHNKQCRNILTEDKATWVGDMNSRLKGAKVALEGLEGDFLCPELTSNWFCSNCHVLKTQLKELESNKKELEAKVASLKLEVSKRKNFERMLTRIDKLKQRIEELESNNDKFQIEIQENLKKYTQDKNAIINEKTALEEQYNKLCKEKQRLKELEMELKIQAEEKTIILRKNSDLEENLQMLQLETLRIKDLEELLHKTSKELKRVQSEKMELEQGGEKAAARVQELEQVVANTQATAKRSIKEKNTAIKEKLNLEIQLSKLLEEIQKLENQKRELEFSKNLISVHNLNMEKKRRDTLKDQEVRLETLSDENSQLHMTIESLEKKVDQLQKDIKKSESKNLSLRKQVTDLQSKITTQESHDKHAYTNTISRELKICNKELSETKIQLNMSNNKLDELTEHLNLAHAHLHEKRQRLARSTLTLVDSWHSVLENEMDGGVLSEFEKRKPPVENILFKGPLDEELHDFQHQIYLTTLLLDTLANLDISLGPSPPAMDHTSCSRSPDSQSHNTTAYVHSDELRDENEIHASNSFSNVLEQDAHLEHFADSVALPTVTDAVLDNLGLLHDGDSTKWTEEELEKKFTLLATHFAVDIKSIQGRHKQQHEHQINLEAFIDNISCKLLRHLKCIRGNVKQKSLINQLNISCHYVELILKLFPKATTSAVQCGALEHEQRFMKCINLMLNHSAHLNKKIDVITHQRKSQSSSLRQRLRSSFCPLNNTAVKQSCLFSNTSNNPHEKDLTLHKTSSLSFIPWLRTFSFLFFVVIFILCCIILEMRHSNAYSMFGYPWDWISWEEVFSPFIKRSYPNGPPPT